ncbi:MAG: hypothetical protein JNK33_00530 [Candidatus Doudnabacteria bacterium]|nr:hypothetical protein [Candidatus Doudnabacteria bacterium]
MISEILLKLGLSEKEVRVYLALLEHGRLTASELARKTKIKRPTMYVILQALTVKHLIAKEPGKKVEVFIPMPPDSLKSLFTQEERELHKKKELAARATLELSQYGSNAVFSIPKVTFVPEEDMNEYLYANTPKWNESMLKYDGILWGFTTPSYVKVLAEYVDWWSEKTIGLIDLKLFSAPDDDQYAFSKKYKHREMKVWPGKNMFNTSLTVQGDFVVMEHTEVKPYYIIDVYDKVLAENLREMFQVLWKTF